MVLLNKYEKLEIKDYDNIQEFINDFVDRSTLCNNGDSSYIVGSREFINECMKMLIDFNFVHLESVSYWNRFNYKDEYYLRMTSYSDAGVYDDYGDMYVEIYPIRSCCIKQNDKTPSSLYGAYTRIFINQNHIKQDIVDNCLDNNDEVMLFDIVD